MKKTVTSIIAFLVICISLGTAQVSVSASEDKDQPKEATQAEVKQDSKGQEKDNSSNSNKKDDVKEDATKVEKEEVKKEKEDQSINTEQVAPKEEIVEEENKIAPMSEPVPQSAPLPQAAPAKVEIPTITYSAHISNVGWMKPVSDGAVAGDVSQSSRLEALKVEVSNTNMKGSINTTAHVAHVGWVAPVASPKIVGTTGQAKAIEALRFVLTDELQQNYDIYYRANIAAVGHTKWAKNGETIGSAGYGSPIIGLEIRLVEKGDTSLEGNGVAFYEKPDIWYNGHSRNVGWTGDVANGATAGTVGLGMRMEALSIAIPRDLYDKGNIKLETHVAMIGWQSAEGKNPFGGTTGQALQMEGVRISLTGKLAEEYDIVYRAHVPMYGWLGWAENGELAGSRGIALRMEAIQVELVHKGFPKPQLSNSYVEAPKEVVEPSVQYEPVYYSQKDPRWGGSVYGSWSLAASGCVPSSLAMIYSSYLKSTIYPFDVANFLWFNTNDFNKAEIGAGGSAATNSSRFHGTTALKIYSLSSLESELSKGRLVIAYMGPGKFTGYGTTHAVVLSKASGGMTYVSDPLNSNNNGWYHLNTIWGQQSWDPADRNEGVAFYSFTK